MKILYQNVQVSQSKPIDKISAARTRLQNDTYARCQDAKFQNKEKRSNIKPVFWSRQHFIAFVWPSIGKQDGSRRLFDYVATTSTEDHTETSSSVMAL